MAQDNLISTNPLLDEQAILYLLDIKKGNNGDSAQQE